MQYRAASPRSSVAFRTVFATVAVALFVLGLLAAPAWAQTTTLDVTKNDSPDPVRVGEDLTYTITVANTGATEAAENVTLEDVLPANTTFRSADVTAGAGNCNEPAVGATGGTVRCNLGDIAVGGSRTIEITVRPTAAAGEAGFVENTASAEGNNTNRARDTERTIVEESGVSVEKDDFPDPADVGESLLYRLRVNNEPGAPRDVNVVDELPDDVDFRSVDVSGDFADASCSESNNVVRCNIEDLAGDGTATVRIFVEPQEEGTIENAARVFAQGDRFTPLAVARERTVVEARDDDNGGGGGGNGGGTTDTLDCDDFSSQAEAQAKLDEDEDDPHNLDPDNDGTACEDFNYNVAVAQTDTTEATTSATGAEATTADTAANAANADDVRDADAFRCEFFLRVVRDDRGALRHQYHDDELIVHRFEQCISADVLRDTIPKRLLPGTGGLPLLGLAALGLAFIVAGASVLGAGIRRGR